MTTPSAPQSGRPTEQRHPLPTGIRITIAVAIVSGAALAFVTMYAVGDLQCREECSAAVPLLWGIGGALLALAGTSVVAVLVARSWGEWRMLKQMEAADRARERAAGQSGRPPADAGPKTC